MVLLVGSAKICRSMPLGARCLLPLAGVGPAVLVLLVVFARRLSPS